MSTNPAKATVVKIATDDGENFDVPLDVLRLSRTISIMLQDLTLDSDSNDPLPISNVPGPIMRKVLQWCTYHKDDSPSINDLDCHKKCTDDISSWDMEFLKVDQETLLEIVLAASYLVIKGLLDITCNTVANMIKGRTPEEIRRTFNVSSSEEEKQIRGENTSCED
ncbi:hypothetical protein KIN20_021517 [Parelaphostrongylus tenuis]|uniref:Skp1-related protein n=1 Tax=Parelaphostrongylus tenuis TaxID=148309 RepID=A0AAD5MGZ5_PARTN|nr:hypothetical protein KIN20_004240 [Parelaphostrongylus tenuis]KAJ1362098.1 hypothetical protein KIN20_021517 [Parelaphostrongylus tenuis]